ncbi:MAG: S-adenosylmethionine:tRNA ribosyltransferase-isomerase [Ginsengibacter sp.]
MHPRNLFIQDYNYTLPEKKIASYPLEKRDESKLLIFRDGLIREDIYRNIANHLPEKSVLIFNDTKVIKARILFQKPSGGVIEIFCLEPYEETNDYGVVLQKTGKVRWKCMIGGAKKWKQNVLEKILNIDGIEVKLCATLVEKLTDAYVAELTWQPPGYSFSEILEYAGDTPLPPYIKRNAEEADVARYQTIYSKFEGSVAAPTAGLHFTPHIFEALREKQISAAFTTLHVGAGTFKPVKSSTMEEHEMHGEWMEISISFIRDLHSNTSNGIFCVGTTSVRTVESIYWMGVKYLLNPHISIEEMSLNQWEVYDSPLAGNVYTPIEALEGLLSFFFNKKIEQLFIQTKIIIAPGYQFRLTNGLVTNFHQPKSTLLLLVAAIAGKDWKRIYEYALENEFRFLSYGDGCLIYNAVR